VSRRAESRGGWDEWTDLEGGGSGGCERERCERFLSQPAPPGPVGRQGLKAEHVLDGAKSRGSSVRRREGRESQCVGQVWLEQVRGRRTAYSAARRGIGGQIRMVVNMAAPTRDRVRKVKRADNLIGSQYRQERGVEGSQDVTPL